MPETLKRKPRNKPAIPPPWPTKQWKVADAPATSAQKLASTSSRIHLTLSDWISVYSFVDAHPHMTQLDIVRHFAALKTGALIFNQTTLSRKLRDHPKMEARINDNPTALSSKRPRIVTCPQVERALVLWIKHMEDKGETVNGPMLQEKWKRFEEELEIPEEERLPDLQDP
ncbi:hypothetical protein PISMIDRAFT_16120 [Pisolithus microcarpus 441]|uniref:HTH CENPB-type domain-containing protein n=1 Tax=Pisolithus microcarpus 441 TaxID=765257 RepID=A0A0C9YH97_9AGAM|nr:hypothetical protein PISMIDRAFT_16120 [Pisolithus microcarpus 441]